MGISFCTVRLAASALVALVAMVVSHPALGAAASAEPYVGSVQSRCTLRVLATGADDQAVRLQVRTAGSAPVRGTVTATFERQGRTIGTVSRAYDGTPLRVRVPASSGPGRTVVRMRFVPESNSTVRSCSASAAIRTTGGGPGGDPGPDQGVGSGGDGRDDGDGRDGDVLGEQASLGGTPGAGAVSGGSDGSDGLLPDTGGPARWLLGLGLLLVVGGAAVTLLSRRGRRRYA